MGSKIYPIIAFDGELFMVEKGKYKADEWGFVHSLKNYCQMGEDNDSEDVDQIIASTNNYTMLSGIPLLPKYEPEVPYSFTREDMLKAIKMARHETDSGFGTMGSGYVDLSFTNNDRSIMQSIEPQPKAVEIEMWGTWAKDTEYENSPSPKVYGSHVKVIRWIL